MKNSSFINQYEKRDEYYTPRILVEPILQYIPNNKRIWCPFDTENSEQWRDAGGVAVHRKLSFWQYADVPQCDVPC